MVRPHITEQKFLKKKKILMFCPHNNYKSQLLRNSQTEYRIITNYHHYEWQSQYTVSLYRKIEETRFTFYPQCSSSASNGQPHKPSSMWTIKGQRQLDSVQEENTSLDTHECQITVVMTPTVDFSSASPDRSSTTWQVVEL